MVSLSKLGKCISFHSYKGGTGKTTIATNFSFLLASKGYSVYLLDLDFYAPSLYSYFDIEPNLWINDYLIDNASIDDIMIDAKAYLKPEFKGELYLGFSKGGKDDIYQLEGNLNSDKEQKLKQFRNFISMREEILIGREADFIIMDTSPGIRYWSINSIVVSDIVLLTLKMGDLDLKGTIKMINEIYSSLIESGSICKLLLNRVSGYCIPSYNNDVHEFEANVESQYLQKVKKMISNTVPESIKVGTLAEIPCYCDIQFKEREYLTVNELPNHPFSIKIDELVEKIKDYA